MTSLTFRETMTGQVALRTRDPIDGYRCPAAVAATMHLRVDIADVAEFVAADHHRAELRVELVAPVLGGRFQSRDGQFVCFERGDGPSGRNVQQMLYTAVLFNERRAYRLYGRKILEPGPPWRVWPDTTTLHVVIVDDTATTVDEAAGIVRLSLPGFLAQLASMRAYGPRGRFGTVVAVVRYGRFFLSGLVKTYVLGARW